MKFLVSAPGKVILFGEHAVVYGYPALSAAIGLRCHFEVTTSQCNANPDSLTVYFKDLEQASICLPKSLCSTKVALTTPNLADYAWSMVSTMVDKPFDSVFRQNALNRSVCVLVYLILRIITLKSDLVQSFSPSVLLLDPQTSIHLNIYSDIPKSAGLGSSAAFSVCASTVLLLLLGHLPFEANWTPSLKQLNMIQQLAHEAESIIHGRSSGLDTSISAQGGLLVYRPMETPCINPLKAESYLEPRILLVDSHVTRSTQTIVHQLSEAYQSNPEIDAVFKEIGALVETAVKLLTRPDTADELGSLVNRNHELLQKLQVSCPRLDDLVCCLNEREIPAKLTGAGCGGFVIGLPLPVNAKFGLAETLDYLHKEKHAWAQIVQISEHGVRFKLCSL